MHSFILQDWITVRTSTPVTFVTQGEEGWLDLTPYQDVIFWVDCREAGSGTPTLHLQTAPIKDEALFSDMITAFALAAQANPTIKPALMTAAGTTVPIARWVRWQITGSTGWDATFRILISANSPGI